MNFLIILFSVLLIGTPEAANHNAGIEPIMTTAALAQPDSLRPDQRTLTISTQGEVTLPADRIAFYINLNAEADSPQKAYQLHQQRENVLVDLLKKFEIAEKDINFEPISISQPHNRLQAPKTPPQYQTSQRVRLMINDFSIYEQMQVQLIESGYDSFSGAFMSSKSEEGKNRAIRAAVQKAKEKARILAEEAGLGLGVIKSINYHETPGRPQYARTEMAIASSDSNLMDFEQTVTISASVNIEYIISGSGGEN